jgi:hypothetical protein
MTRRIARVTLSIAFLVALSPRVAAAQEAERSRTEGLKETDRFVKSGGATTAKVAEAKNQVKATLDAYNALVTQPSKNMKGDYKKLLKSSDAMNDRFTEAKQKIDEMQKAGEVYFSGRAGTNKNIQDQDLQKRANQRLEEAQKSYADVIEKLRAAGQALEPFKKQLADQITYLGSDLTPSAMESLKPNAEKLNKQGEEVFAKVDEAVTHANEYFNSLRSTES